MTNNRIESFAKYAGIATVAIEWSALLAYYLLMPAYFGNKYPISYFDYLPQTRLVFNICYTLAGIFFWIFIKHHLHKHYPVPLKILGLSMLFFIGLALFPFNPNNPTNDLIHSSLGMISAILLIIGLSIMTKTVKDRIVYRGTMIMLVCSLILFAAFLVSPKQSNLIFAFEAGSWLVLQLWVFWISFYTIKNPLLK